MSSTVISSSQKLYKTFEKVSSDITAKNPLRFGVWISDETLDTVSLIQLFCSRQSETFYPNL